MAPHIPTPAPLESKRFHYESAPIPPQVHRALTLLRTGDSIQLRPGEVWTILTNDLLQGVLHYVVNFQEPTSEPASEAT